MSQRTTTAQWSGDRITAMEQLGEKQLNLQNH
jgi:hypothetical protein